MNSTRLYALCDIKDDPRKRWGAFEVSEQRARQLNKEGFGIFFTPNDFEGKRKIENLKQINYYIADIDEGGKEKIWCDVKKLLLKPSVIVETKRGYHLYWKVKDGSLDNYEKIENCIIKKLNADTGAKDCSRLLRCPSFYHMKDPENPFLIKIIEENDNIYKENELYLYFKGHEKKYRPIRIERQKFKSRNDFKSEKEMLDFLDAAIEDISSRVTKIGAAQNRVSSAITALDVQSQNITSSLSTLRDTDIASESSAYIQAQILQQASATLLATANQAPSVALNLI